MHSHFYSQINRNILNKVQRAIFNEKVKIDKYPRNIIPQSFIDNCNTNIVLGDLHANSKKLVHHLTYCNVFNMSECQYDSLMRSISGLQKVLENTDAIDLNAQKHLDVFDMNLAKVKVDAFDGHLTFLGDDVAGQGQNDLLTLKVFSHMRQNKVSFDVLFSNHGMEFLTAYEEGFQDFSPRYMSGYTDSLVALGKLVDTGLLSKMDLERLVSDGYIPQLKILSYSVDHAKKNITLFSHAPIGLNTIRSLAAMLGVEYSDINIMSLCKTIDKINICFGKLLKNKSVHEASNFSHKPFKDDAPMAYPFVRVACNRFPNEEKDPRSESINGYNIYFVHGHWWGAKVNPDQENILNLDNRLGRSIEEHSGELSILVENNILKQSIQLEATNNDNLAMDDDRISSQCYWIVGDPILVGRYKSFFSFFSPIELKDLHPQQMKNSLPMKQDVRLFDTQEEAFLYAYNSLKFDKRECYHSAVFKVQALQKPKTLYEQTSLAIMSALFWPATIKESETMNRKTLILNADYLVPLSVSMKIKQKHSITQHDIFCHESEDIFFNQRYSGEDDYKFSYL